MQFNTFVTSLADLDRCVQAPGLEEILLEPALLARQGTLTDAQVQELAIAAHQRQLRPVLVWDALMPERLMASIEERFANWNFVPFAAIRVCDPGAAYWVHTHLPDKPLQLIVETGHHNRESLLGWCELLQGSLERLILSIELPEPKLVEYCQTLPVACELLGVGQILLFYSPRSLLATPLDAEDAYLETTVAFEDAPNRHFPTVETTHGTLMFLDKDQFILDQLQTLQDAGLHTVRLDLRHLSQSGDAAPGIDQLCQQILTNPAEIRATWPRETRAPFFKANRTTALFPRIKSHRSHPRQDPCLAEAIAGEGGNYVVFQTLRSFHTDQIAGILLPTGETVPPPKTLTFRSIQGDPLDQVDADQLLLTDWIKKVVPGSLLLGAVTTG